MYIEIDSVCARKRKLTVLTVNNVANACVSYMHTLTNGYLIVLSVKLIDKGQ